MDKDNRQLPGALSASLGTVRSKGQLQENLFRGEVEYATGRTRPCMIRICPDGPLGAGDELAQRRFMTESLLGLDLSREHVNLLSTLHVGVWHDGRLFQALAQEPGRTVAELYEQLCGHYSTVETIARGVLRALRYLHRSGVVHGAVTDSNILVSADGVIRLGDFSRSRRVSKNRLFPGQVLAEGMDDMRALGRVLFELATGRPASELDALPDLDGHSPGDLLPTDVPAVLSRLIVRLLDADDPISADEALLALGERPEPLVDPREVFEMVQAQQALHADIKALLSMDGESRALFANFLTALTSATDATADVAGTADASLDPLAGGEQPKESIEESINVARPAVPDVIPVSPPGNRWRRWPIAAVAGVVLALSFSLWDSQRPATDQPAPAERAISLETGPQR